jgi:hypothetical protein
VRARSDLVDRDISINCTIGLTVLTIGLSSLVPGEKSRVTRGRRYR